jgi:hypothetical protein
VAVVVDEKTIQLGWVVVVEQVVTVQVLAVKALAVVQVLKLHCQ